MSLLKLASEQSKATIETIININQLLDYLGTHPDTMIPYYASDMILNIHSDASYLSAKQAQSRSARYFFLGWTPQDSHPIRLNGLIFNFFTILKFVAASTAQVELVVFVEFLNEFYERPVRHLIFNYHLHSYNKLLNMGMI